MNNYINPKYTQRSRPAMNWWCHSLSSEQVMSQNIGVIIFPIIVGKRRIWKRGVAASLLEMHNKAAPPPHLSFLKSVYSWSIFPSQPKYFIESQLCLWVQAGEGNWFKKLNPQQSVGIKAGIFPQEIPKNIFFLLLQWSNDVAQWFALMEMRLNCEWFRS